MAQTTVETQPDPPRLKLEELAASLKEANLEEEADLGFLAAEFGVEEEFVSDVLAVLRRPSSQTPQIVESWRAFKRGFVQVLMKVRRWLRAATAKPLKFILTSGIFAAALWLLAVVVEAGVSSTSTEEDQVFALAGIGAVAAIASVLVLILHQACYYRHGTIKWPLKGGLWFVIVSIPFAAVTAFKLEQVMPQMTAGAAGLALGLVILIVAALYTGLGIISAMVGEQARVKKGEQLHDTMTRQQLLERLFTAQARLSEVTRDEDGLKRRKSLRERARTSPVFPLYGAVVGLAFGLAKVLVISGLLALIGASQPVARGLEIIFGLMGVSAVFILGYYTGSIMRALTAVLSAYGAALLTYLLPVGDFGLVYVQDLIANRDQVQQLYLMLFIAAVSGWGGMVESKGMQQKRLRADDPAALLAEIVTLQRRLSPKSKSACVLVVDAAKSTVLKAGANPLDIEYTFREYQNLVRRISSKWGGEVLSTAGDGAVVGFSSPSDAVNAGKVIQTEMAHFNAHTNRLSSPVRLRIGVHCGETATDLQEAPYNSLIDIAAHVEETAPVGGIAVTETVAGHLEEEKMAEIKDKVHDLTVLFLLTPTTTS